MPDEITYRGTNDQGNRYDNRVDTSTGNTGYHYSNSDGSYYYKNTDSSTYYNTGNGYAQYNSASGNTTHYYGNNAKK